MLIGREFMCDVYIKWVTFSRGHPASFLGALCLVRKIENATITTRIPIVGLKEK